MSTTEGMAPTPQQRPAMGTGPVEHFDAIVIGAGVSGLGDEGQVLNYHFCYFHKWQSKRPTL